MFRPGHPSKTLEEEYRDPTFRPRPRYWINQGESPVTQSLDYFLAFKEITASTNVRTMMAAVVPHLGCIDTLPVLLPLDERVDEFGTACIVADLNSSCFDYVTRQKVPSTHIKTVTCLSNSPNIAGTD